MEDDTESTRLANERLTINLRRAFANLLTELKHAYGSRLVMMRKCSLSMPSPCRQLPGF
jgi:hypothetical protein